MLLNVKKGPYPSLVQVDEEKLVSDDETTAIERGQCLYVDANDEWRVAGDAQAGSETTPGAFIWFAFQNEDDLTAGMAGGTPTTGGAPKIAAIACSPTIEIETDMYDQAGSLALHDLLTVADGGILAAHASGNTIYGRVTKAPYTRWQNNAVAVSGWRTGNNVNAISALTMYVPNVVTA